MIDDFWSIHEMLLSCCSSLMLSKLVGDGGGGPKIPKQPTVAELCPSSFARREPSKATPFSPRHGTHKTRFENASLAMDTDDEEVEKLT